MGFNNNYSIIKFGRCEKRKLNSEFKLPKR